MVLQHSAKYINPKLKNFKKKLINQQPQKEILPRTCLEIDSSGR